jgi:hypothetical protein
MPIDPSIPLSYNPGSPMQSLASVAGIASQMQYMRNAQVENQILQQNQQNEGISLQERKNLQGILSDPSQYTGPDGNVDFNKAVPLIMKAAPTTGLQYVQNLMTAQEQGTQARRAINSLTDENRERVGQVLYSLPKDASPDLVNSTLDGLAKQYPGIQMPAGMVKQAYNAHLAQNDPDGAYGVLQRAALNVLPQQTQQDIQSGALSAVPTENGTQLVQLKTGANAPQGAPVGQPYTPPNQITTSPTGGLVRINAATGVADNLHPSGGAEAPLTNYPPGENAATYQTLEDQRNAALLAANQAPVMHNITAEIKNALDSGVPAGQLGGTIAKFRSVLGIASPASEQSASNYDILGKMLERQALVAAQGMGPQTNAGLEAQIKANGSPHYNPTALREIANLNDALVTGSQKYQQGLEQAINQNGLFSKRQYDQQWSQNADPYALRLLNAAKNGDQQEIHDIFTRIGGPNSAQGKALQQKLLNLKKLSETGSLQ